MIRENGARDDPAGENGRRNEGRKPDRVPVNPFAIGYCAKIIGVPIGDVYADGDKCFEAEFTSMRLHGYEATPMYGYASIGAWEFGGKVRFPYKRGMSAPDVLEHPVNDVEDVEELEVPTFENELPGSYAEADKVMQRCRELDMPAIIQGGSTFTAAANVVDTEKFLKWVRGEPEVAHRLLEKVSDMFVNALEYFAEKYGAENCLPFDGGPVDASTVIFS